MRVICKRLLVTSVKDYWKVLTGALLATTGRICGSTKDPSIHVETWWRNNDAIKGLLISMKFERSRNTSKEKPLEAIRKARKAFYQAKCEAERNRFAGVSRIDDQKFEVFWIVKTVLKTNQDIRWAVYNE